MTTTATAATPEPQQRPVVDLPGTLPRRRQDLIIRPAGEAGRFVVKAPASASYFQIGEAERFLLDQLDGQKSAAEVCAAFETQFGEPLTPADVGDFLRMAASMEMLELAVDQHGVAIVAGAAVRTRRPPTQNFLYFRRSLFDPDKFFDWLEPKIRFVWSRAFVLFCIATMVGAFLIAWTNRHEFIGRFESLFHWQVLALFWVTVVITMVLHEFAHGLTCKHFGGEVHEVGVLVMFFTPCFYCNVSDAWLFSERWKRIWVGVAGPFLDLCLWALATFVWRLTVHDSAVNFIAWTIMATCASRTVLNFNPLMKSDGYYLLSDWTQIPNLSRTGLDRWAATARWLLWGAARPERIPRGRFVVLYGLASWLFIVLFLFAMVQGLLHLPKGISGWFGFGLSLLVVPLMMFVALHGILTKEVIAMFKTRTLRTVIWLLVLAAVGVGLAVIPFSDRAGGSFQVRPRTRVEVRALEAGFLRDINVDEGSDVAAGAVIARIDVPDLQVTMRKKQAELRETRARLKMLEMGPRKEEIDEQRQRVVRYIEWRDLAKDNLLQAREALAQDLIRLDRQIAQYEAELSYATRIVEQARLLYEQNAFSGEQMMGEEKKANIARFQLDQAKAQKRSREATGTIEFESELAKREKELSEVRSALALLEIGTRPEEIEAERAKMQRLEEDLAYLQTVRSRVVVQAPVCGIVTTARVKEKNGQYFEKGALICVIEDPSQLEAEITLPEEEAAGVLPGQDVLLKARALPFETFHTTVDRKAPRAFVGEGKLQGTVTIYCHVSETDSELLSGMTGFARITRSHQPIGWILGVHVLRLLRTEFWW